MAFTWLALAPMAFASGANDNERSSTPPPVADDRGSPNARDPLSRPVWTTASQARLIQLDEGTSITLAPFSEVLHRAMVPVDLGVRDASPMVHSLELTKGAVQVDVRKGKFQIHGVLVRAPRKVGAIIKNGRSTITTDAAQTTVAARAGRDMMVSVAEHWRGLRVGRVFCVSATNPLGQQRPILPPPVAEAEHPVQLAFDQRPSRHRIQWKPVEGSKSYLVRTLRITGNEEIDQADHRTTDPEVALEGLAAGRYRVQVAAVDELGLESDFGAPVTLRVVEAILPDGASQTEKGLRLPAHERVLLRNIEDLELTYGSSSTMFLPAPGSIGLHDGRGVVVRLRDKESAEETRLTLEPLDFALNLTLQPPGATWPGRPVHVRFSMRCSDGTPSPEISGVVPHVAVNSQPLAVSWNRTVAGELSASIEKPPTRGPWVIRVVVRNRHGHVLIRDFLEVAEQQAQPQ